MAITSILKKSIESILNIDKFLIEITKQYKEFWNKFIRFIHNNCYEMLILIGSEVFILY